MTQWRRWLDISRVSNFVPVLRTLSVRGSYYNSRQWTVGEWSLSVMLNDMKQDFSWVLCMSLHAGIEHIPNSLPIDWASAAWRMSTIVEYVTLSNRVSSFRCNSFFSSLLCSSSSSGELLIFTALTLLPLHALSLDKSHWIAALHQ